MTKEKHMRRSYTEECKRDAVALITEHRLPGNGRSPLIRGDLGGLGVGFDDADHSGDLLWSVGCRK